MINKVLKIAKQNLLGFIVGAIIFTGVGVTAATILAGSEVSYTGSKVSGANNIQQAIDDLYTKATTSSSECRTGYQKQNEDGPNYQCSRIARQCSGDNCTVCIRAERLHTETCNRASGFCKEDYSTGDTITYGNTSITSGVLNTGDAFDCDVNGDGTYDSNTERFYYVSTKNNGITTDSNTAVLIYYNNTIEGVSSNSSSSWYKPAYNNSYGPETARSNLPTTSQWSNVQLTQTVRDITYDNNSVAVSNFSYEGYAARLITYQEVNTGCYDGISIDTVGSLISKCKFLMENSYYSSINGQTEGPLLETTWGNNASWRVYSTNRRLSPWNTVETENGVRPAIEVQLSEIEY